MTTELVPVESVKPGQTIRIVDYEVPGFEGKFNALNRVYQYLVHDVEKLHGGEEVRITYGTDSGSWTDAVSFEAGELVDAA